MNMTSLFRAQLRHALRTPWVFFFILLAIGLALAAGLSDPGPQADRFRVAVVCEDEGPYGFRLIEALSAYENLDLRQLAGAAAMDLLRQDRLEAVFVIRSHYSESLLAGKFHQVIDWYTAPSSRAAATISEPLVNQTMRFWIEEQTILLTRTFLLEQGLAYSAADERNQRDRIDRLQDAGASVFVNAQLLTADNEAANQEPASAGPDLLGACVRWYGIFCVFYLVVGASWVLDMNKRSLRIRASQNGIHLWQILLGTSLVPLLICFAGYLVTGALCCVLADAGWLRMLALGLPVLLYLIAALGMTIVLTSFLRQTLALLFLAPLVTFVNAVLGGLIAPLPEWAAVLAVLSRALPGRWLQLALDNPAKILPGILICCLGWLAAGIALSGIRKGLRRQTSG